MQATTRWQMSFGTGLKRNSRSMGFKCLRLIVREVIDFGCFKSVEFAISSAMTIVVLPSFAGTRIRILILNLGAICSECGYNRLRWSKSWRESKLHIGFSRLTREIWMRNRERILVPTEQLLHFQNIYQNPKGKKYSRIYSNFQQIKPSFSSLVRSYRREIPLPIRAVIRTRP